jgi:DNA-binding response OmpR family regulator
MVQALLSGVVETACQRILVVDNDPAILHMLARRLDLAGYEVLTAVSGQQALEVIDRVGLPHLAVVETQMSGMDGASFCQTVQAYSDLPVIMLSGVNKEETAVAMLEQYAEDYVLKPFSAAELVARIGRVLRRIGDFSYALAPVIQVDEHLAVNFPHQRACVGQREVALSPTETKLLFILMRNAGFVVGSDFLLRRLWPHDEVFENGLRIHIHRLRAKLEPDPSHPRYIITERGQGYRFGLKPQVVSAARDK